jgi:hypothetical protein
MSDLYFQFPVSSLRFCKPIDQVSEDEKRVRLDSIIDYCCVQMGRAVWDDIEPEEVIEKYLTRNETKGSVKQNICKLAIVGADRLGVNYFELSPTHISNNCDAVTKHGGTMLVRMRTDLFWDAKIDNAAKWPWKRFSLLAGVYAGVGGHTARKVSLNYIQALALGFQSMQTFNAANGSRWALKYHKTRYIVDKLVSDGFFVRASANRRHAWYSNSLNLNELVTFIANQTVKKDKPTASEIRHAIQAKIARVKGVAK